MYFSLPFLQIAWRIVSASVCMSGSHFASAARCSRLPVAVGGRSRSPSSPAPQPASASAATTPVSASIGRVSLMMFLRSFRRHAARSPGEGLSASDTAETARALNPGSADGRSVRGSCPDGHRLGRPRDGRLGHVRGPRGGRGARLPSGDRRARRRTAGRQPARPARTGLRLGFDGPLGPGGPAAPRSAGRGSRAARRPYKARRARIRPASSLRNTGRAAEGVALPRPERDAPQDESDDAVRAVPAVGLSDLGRDREGLALVLEALAGHLPRYRRSLAAYAHGLVEPGRDTAPASGGT